MWRVSVVKEWARGVGERADGEWGGERWRVESGWNGRVGGVESGGEF